MCAIFFVDLEHLTVTETTDK